MKIGTIEIYEKYIENIRSTIEFHKDEVNGYNTSKEYLLGKLKIFEHYIRNFTNIKFNDIKDLNRFLSDKQILGLKELDQIGLDLNLLRITINNIVDINKSIIRCNRLIKDLEENYISKNIFKEVIYKFNEKVSNEIVYKGYCFELGFRLGWVKIKKINITTRKKKKINWGESNKRKAELIGKGILPYKAEYDNERNLISDNGGVKWFIYHTGTYDYLWNWVKKYANAENVPYYKFRPTRYDNIINEERKLGNVNKLKSLVTSNSELLKNYL